jgi:hypothetical protein
MLLSDGKLIIILVPFLVHKLCPYIDLQLIENIGYLS